MFMVLPFQGKLKYFAILSLQLWLHSCDLSPSHSTAIQITRLHIGQSRLCQHR